MYMIFTIKLFKSLIFALTLNIISLIIRFKELLLGIYYGKMSKMWS